MLRPLQGRIDAYFSAYRWYRCAQPPANSCDPSGVECAWIRPRKSGSYFFGSPKSAWVVRQHGPGGVCKRQAGRQSICRSAPPALFALCTLAHHNFRNLWFTIYLGKAESSAKRLKNFALDSVLHSTSFPRNQAVGFLLPPSFSTCLRRVRSDSFRLKWGERGLPMFHVEHCTGKKRLLLPGEEVERVWLGWVVTAETTRGCHGVPVRWGRDPLAGGRLGQGHVITTNQITSSDHGGSGQGGETVGHLATPPRTTMARKSALERLGRAIQRNCGRPFGEVRQGGNQPHQNRSNDTDVLDSSVRPGSECEPMNQEAIRHWLNRPG